jgi:hypothetical protein
MSVLREKIHKDLYVSSTQGILIGTKTNPKGGADNTAIVIGHSASAWNDSDVPQAGVTLIGYTATGKSPFATALGNETICNGEYSVAIGSNSSIFPTSADRAMSLSSYGICSHSSATMLGFGCETSADKVTLLGYAAGKDMTTDPDPIFATNNTACNAVGGVYMSPYIAQVADATQPIMFDTVTKQIGPGKGLIQRVYTSSTTRMTISSNIPEDNTKPQVTEGTEVINVSITPKSSTTSRIRATIEFPYMMAASNTAYGVIAMFASTVSATDAIDVSMLGPNSTGPAHFCHSFEFAPTSTATMNVSIRAGVAGGASSIYVLGSNAMFNATQHVTLTLEEYCVL